MSFVRQQDNQAKRSPRLTKYFNGIHLGFSPTDQGQEYAFTSDLECWQHRLRLRAGHKKNEEIGYVYNVDAIFQTNIQQKSMIAVITGGVLILYPVADLDTGLDNFYTWDDVKKEFTWSSLKKKTWRDLIRKGQT